MEHLARPVLRPTTTIDRRTRIIARTKRPLVPTRTKATMGVRTKLRAAATRRHVPVIRHLGGLTRRRIRGHTLLPTGTPRQAVATPHRAIRHRAAVTRHQANNSAPSRSYSAPSRSYSAPSRSYSAPSRSSGGSAPRSSGSSSGGGPRGGGGSSPHGGRGH